MERIAWIGRSCLLAWLAGLPGWAADTAPWVAWRTPHFELMTSAREGDARSLLSHLRQLRELFYERRILTPETPGTAVRILAFRTDADYAPYRLTESATAYYAGAPGRDYIVMTLSGPDSLALAAHEYVHLMVRHSGVKLPTWLAEGLAEVYSTARFHAGEATVGAPQAGRLRMLRQSAWLPLTEVAALTAVPEQPRARGPVFYAESWGLTHLLLFSPEYRGRSSELLRKCASGMTTALAFAEVYGKSLMEVDEDLRSWVAQRKLPVLRLPGGAPPEQAGAPEPLPETAVQLALAELQLAIGHREQAGAVYRRLESRLPRNPDVQAALGRIALAAGQPSEARERFRRAVALGLRDARLCYDYAMLAQDTGLPEGDVVAALERALAIDPSLDDARYSLALAHMNAGRYAAALRYFQALRMVPPKRAFAYYTGLAHTQLELGLREDAARSAAEARRWAKTDDERVHAGELAWVADSDLVVQLTPDGKGRMRRIARREHREEQDWNPFIEPGDRIERQEGELQEVACSPDGIRLTVSAPDRTLVLSLPNPSRVQVRKSGSGTFEFTCGKQEALRVKVEFARSNDAGGPFTGVLRGIQVLD